MRPCVLPTHNNYNELDSLSHCKTVQIIFKSCKEISDLIILQLMMIWLTTGSLFKGMKTVMLPRSTDECNETDWQIVLTEGSGTNLTSLQHNVTAQPELVRE